MNRRTTFGALCGFCLALASCAASTRTAAWGPRGPLSAQESVARNRPPLALDLEERKVLDVLAELDAERRGNMNVPEEDGRLLRILVRAMNAQRVVEIGTSNGYSAIWMALALRETGGRLVTHEIDPERAERARANFERAGVADLIELVLGDAHERVEELEGPIDLLFIDADKPGYLDYLDKCLPKLRAGGLVLAHNMRAPAPDPRFVHAITREPELETIFLHMEGAGMGLTLKK